MNRISCLLTTAALAVACSTSVLADSVAIRDGTDPTAAQLGHVFLHVCKPKNPFLMEKEFALLSDAFRWTPTDSDADVAFVSPSGEISAIFDANYEGATCTLMIPSEISSDGGDLYESLDAHLRDTFDDLPAAAAIDGGLQWEWVQSGSLDLTFIISFTETGEGHILRAQSKQF